jgi:hypothetical protein
MAPSHLPFSKRQGYDSQPKEITIREDAPEKLRYWILETLQGLGWNPSQMREVVCRALREIPDRSSSLDYYIWEEARWLVRTCEWFRIYDIIEAFYAQLVKNDLERGLGVRPENDAAQFAEAINAFLGACPSNAKSAVMATSACGSPKWESQDLAT